MLADEDKAERHDREIEAAQAQRERADEEPDQRADDPGGGKPDQDRQLELAAEVARGVRAEAEEERVAE